MAITKTDSVPLPPRLAGGIMRRMPAGLVNRGTQRLVRTLRQRHPRLFKNLETMEAVTVRIELLDVPHQFILQAGNGQASLRLVGSNEPTPNVIMRGKLEIFLALLEGQIDSDAVFFTRELEISGDMSAAVALRNILDREEMHLLDDIISLSGPFAPPVTRIISRLDRIARRTREHVARFHQSLHRDDAGGRNLEAEYDALRAEIQELRTRLAKSTVHQKRTQTEAV